MATVLDLRGSEGEVGKSLEREIGRHGHRLEREGELLVGRGGPGIGLGFQLSC